LAEAIKKKYCEKCAVRAKIKELAPSARVVALRTSNQDYTHYIQRYTQIDPHARTHFVTPLGYRSIKYRRHPAEPTEQVQE